MVEVPNNILYIFSVYDPSGDTLSLFSLDSVASTAPSVYTKYSKGSKWSHAKPQPLSTDVPSTTKDQSSNTPTVETTNQATQYETQEPTVSLHGSVEQNLPSPLHSASEPRVPHPPQSSSITTLARVQPVQVDSSSTLLEAARVTHQPSTPSTTEATTVAENQVNVMPSLQQNVDQGVAQQPVSTVTQASFSRDQQRDDQIASQVPTIEFEEQPSPAATHPSTTSAAPHDMRSSMQGETENDRAQQPSSTVAAPSIAVIQPTEGGSMPQVSGQRPMPNHMQAQIQYNQQADSSNNQPSSTVAQASIPADQPADDDNFSLISARQPDSSHLLQSTEVQQPADMSASLNYQQQGAFQPSSTIPLQSLEDAQQPHDDMGSI